MGELSEGRSVEPMTPENGAPSPEVGASSSPSAAPGASRARRWVLLGVLAAGLVGGLGWFAWRWYTTPVPPEVPLEDVDPAIVEVIERARIQVLEQPGSAKAWGDLGIVLQVHAFSPQSTECYQVAEKLDPRDRRWVYFQAMNLLHERPDQAIPLLRRTIRLSPPDSFEPRLRLAEALLEAGHKHEAEDYFQEVLRLRRNSYPAQLGMGKLLVARGDVKHSLPYLQKAARGPETRKIANRLLVIVYSRLAIEAKAHPDGTAKAQILAWEREAAHAQQQARQLPDDLPWFDSLVHEADRQSVGMQKQLRLVERLRALGHHGEAGKILQDLAPKYPEDSWVHYLLGKSYGLQRKYEEAKNEFRIALKNQPNMVLPLFHLGLTLLIQAEEALPDRNQRATALRRLKEAEDYFHQVIQLKADHALAHNRLGLCYELQHKPAQALQAYRTALVCQPEHLNSRLKVAELLLHKGNDAAALVYLQEVLNSLVDPKEKKQPAFLLRLVLGRSLLWH